MPKRKLDWQKKQDYLIMVRFMNRHKAVIQAACDASGCKSQSEWVKRIVWSQVVPFLDADDDPLCYGPLLAKPSYDEKPF